MGKKKQHAGILAIDPSWKGMAIAAYIPVHGISFTECDDIRGNSKSFDTPANTIKSVTAWARDLFDKWPQLACCTRIVIENQFKTKMRNLEYITVSAIKMLMHRSDITVEYVPILKLKKHFDLELQHNHRKNKNLAVAFVQENERELLCGSLHDDDDNKADAILLLNYSVQTQKLEMAEYGECDHCGNELVARECKQGANEGKWFVNCSNGKKAEGKRPANKCNSVFNWLEERDDGTWAVVPKENKWGPKKPPGPGAASKKSGPATAAKPRTAVADNVPMTEIREMFHSLTAIVKDVVRDVAELKKRPREEDEPKKQPPKKKVYQQIAIPEDDDDFENDLCGTE